MGCKAILMKVNDKQRIRLKLTAWTSEDPDEIINNVENGNPRIITTLDCDDCKVDLEKDGAAIVNVEEN